MTEKWEEKEFTPADLTKTRHINKLAAQRLEAAFLDLPLDRRPPVISITGAVTKCFRDRSWDLLPLLGRKESDPGAAANPINIALRRKRQAEENGEDFNLKKELRGITHMHHALDATALGLITQLLVPLGHMALNGDLSRLIVKGKLNADERAQFEALRHQFGLPKFYCWAAGRCDDESQKSAERGQGGTLCIDGLPEWLKEMIRTELAKKRVVQHIPKRMSGLRVEENTRGVEKVEDGRVHLRQQKRDEKTGKLKISRTIEVPGKLLGLNPKDAEGRLKEISGVRVIEDNFGVAILDHATDEARRFAIIPYHKVWPRLQELKRQNQNKMPRVLRIGSLIQVPNRSRRSDYRGIWMVRGAQLNQRQGLLVDLSAPDTIEYRVAGRSDCYQNVRLQSLYEGGLLMLNPALTGVPYASGPAKLA